MRRRDYSRRSRRITSRSTFGAGGSTRDGRTRPFATSSRRRASWSCPSVLLGVSRAALRTCSRATESSACTASLLCARTSTRGATESTGPFQHANELVGFIREFVGSRSPLVVPEFHPESATAIGHSPFVRKVRAGATKRYPVFFQQRRVLRVRRQRPPEGVDIRSSRALMPITDYQQIARFFGLLRRGIPPGSASAWNRSPAISPTEGVRHRPRHATGRRSAAARPLRDSLLHLEQGEATLRIWRHLELSPRVSGVVSLGSAAQALPSRRPRR